MNYEQKYKNALGKLQEALAPTKGGCKIFGLTRGCIENIFPELKESKEERIRKGIIRNLEYLADRAEGFVKDELKERIAWLEKQDKQKQEANYPKFEFNDILALQCCMETVKKVQEDKELYGQLQSLHNRLYDAYQLEKRGEQKAYVVDFKAKDWYVSKVDGKIYNAKFMGNPSTNHRCDAKHEIEKQGEQPTEPKWCHHKVDLSDCSEEYRKAYYDGWNNCNIQHSQCKVENNDNDEKIRKELVEFIKSRGGFKQEYIDWLEKQESVGEIVERCKTSWYNEGKIDGQIEGLSDDEKYQQGWHDALEKQSKQKQTWKPSIAQKIVIKELIEDKNTSNVHRVILRGMLDEFKQFTNNCKRETDNYETEDSSQT